MGPLFIGIGIFCPPGRGASGSRGPLGLVEIPQSPPPPVCGGRRAGVALARMVGDEIRDVVALPVDREHNGHRGLAKRRKDTLGQTGRKTMRDGGWSGSGNGGGCANTRDFFFRFRVKSANICLLFMQL